MAKNKPHKNDKQNYNNEKGPSDSREKGAYGLIFTYATFGILWVLFSDIILGFFFDDLEKYKTFQTYKGWFFVFITTILVYYVKKRNLKLWEAEYYNKVKVNHELKQAYDEVAELESELIYQRTLNENIIREAPSIIITWDDKGKILSINPFGQKLTGYTEEELIDSVGWAVIIPDGRINLAVDTYEEILKVDGTLVYDGAIITKDGKNIDVLWSSTRLKNLSDDTQSLFVSIGTDIEERKRYEEKIENLAYYDTLTGLPNRILFEQEVNRSINSGCKKFMIAYMDIDNFKNINDTIGHQAGDVFLQYFANRMINKTKGKAFAARLGGDEFAILYQDVSNEKVTREVEELLSEINKIWSYQNRLFYISMSVGIVIYPDHGSDTYELLKNVDIAMYASKNEGKNRILFYSEDFMEESFRFNDMVNYLQEGINLEQFFLVYQPQYKLSSKELIGMEALLRWNHPKEGFISPAEFIPVAEKTGQIYHLERWVIKKALEQKKYWEQQGLNDLVLAINLSTKTLTSEINFAEWEQILSEYSVDYSKVVIEITETADILNVDNVINRLNILKKRGIRIALDDFGTGYSSLNYLKKFPIDIIKLDKSFINSITENGVDNLLIRNILKLASDLQYDVIAEGIETADQMNRLIEYNCDSGQGFLLSKPLSVDKINDLLSIE
ncbi:MAG: EAL domain-containing protein [Clostridiales bacterium]|nr:EAL domain-containing protein [Clostridiales bacterium]